MRLECSNKEFQGKCKHRIQKSKTEGLKNAFLYFLNFIEHVLLNQHYTLQYSEVLSRTKLLYHRQSGEMIIFLNIWTKEF